MNRGVFLCCRDGILTRSVNEAAADRDSENTDAQHTGRKGRARAIYAGRTRRARAIYAGREERTRGVCLLVVHGP